MHALASTARLTSGRHRWHRLVALRSRLHLSMHVIARGAANPCPPSLQHSSSPRRIGLVAAKPSPSALPPRAIGTCPPHASCQMVSPMVMGPSPVSFLVSGMRDDARPACRHTLRVPAAGQLTALQCEDKYNVRTSGVQQVEQTNLPL